MTYALAWPLQEALYRMLTTTPEIDVFFERRVFDAPPPFEGAAAPAGLYAVIGDEVVEDWSTATDHGAEHRIVIAVNAPRLGFAEAKQAAGAVADALLAGGLAPSRGRVVSIGFVDAKTRRDEAGALRRIELRFRVVVEDDA